MGSSQCTNSPNKNIKRQSFEKIEFLLTSPNDNIPSIKHINNLFEVNVQSTSHYFNEKCIIEKDNDIQSIQTILRINPIDRKRRENQFSIKEIQNYDLLSVRSSHQPSISNSINRSTLPQQIKSNQSNLKEFQSSLNITIQKFQSKIKILDNYFVTVDDKKDEKEFLYQVSYLSDDKQSVIEDDNLLYCQMNRQRSAKIIRRGILRYNFDFRRKQELKKKSVRFDLPKDFKEVNHVILRQRRNQNHSPILLSPRRKLNSFNLKNKYSPHKSPSPSPRKSPPTPIVEQQSFLKQFVKKQQQKGKVCPLRKR